MAENELLSEDLLREKYDEALCTVPLAKEILDLQKKKKENLKIEEIVSIIKSIKSKPYNEYIKGYIFYLEQLNEKDFLNYFKDKGYGIFFSEDKTRIDRKSLEVLITLDGIYHGRTDDGFAFNCINDIINYIEYERESCRRIIELHRKSLIRMNDKDISKLFSWLNEQESLSLERYNTGIMITVKE